MSADDLSELPFKLHDFGSRGATSQEAAGIGGMAHLINFMGTDTIVGALYAQETYGASIAGFSIPASEHSTITMWGRENEVEAYRNMIKQYGDGAVFACVSDSYDIYNATENYWGDELKAEVLAMNATLVVRPDSGNPVEVVINLLKILDEKYGHTINSKGFKVLNKVRVIQGDGIGIAEVKAILQAALELGYSATNLTFGMGGGLLQKDLNRDTHKFAFKCCSAVVGGKEVDVSKDPVTDPSKKSKQGKLDLVISSWDKENNKMEVYTSNTNQHLGISLLETVYENGKLLKAYTLDEVRENTKIEITCK